MTPPCAFSAQLVEMQIKDPFCLLDLARAPAHTEKQLDTRSREAAKEAAVRVSKHTPLCVPLCGCAAQGVCGCAVANVCVQTVAV